MTITYPITPPTTTPDGIQLNGVSAIAQTTSPFTYEQEIFEHLGQMWEMSVSIPPMEQDEAEEWVSFLLSLNGIQGTFIYGDPAGQTPRGNPSGTPVIDGAGQNRAKVLNTRGWTPSTVIFKPGDYIQLPGNRLHKVLTETTSDISGNAAIDIFPRVRDVQSDGAGIIVTGCKGVFRLVNNDPNWNIGAAKIYGLSFEAREAI